MIHHNTIQDYIGTLPELAEKIGDLRYDALAEFLEMLSAKIERDGLKDEKRGRAQLAQALQECASELANAAVPMKKAWKIAEPFMPGTKTMP